MGAFVFIAFLSCVIGINGQFMLSFGTPTPARPNVFDPNCKDKLDTCWNFPDSSCQAPYEDWAKDYCGNRCGYCVGPTTPAPPCVDKLPNCELYDNSVCTSPDYATWAKDNCRFFCRQQFCDPAEVARLEAMTTTVRPEDCQDRVDCRNYGPNACSDQFKAWSRDNCPLHCGYCRGAPTPAPACEDRIPNCAEYDGDTCTNVAYKSWVEDNCRKFCGLCSGGSSGSSSSGSGPATPAPPMPPMSVTNYPVPVPGGHDTPTVAYVPPSPPSPGKRGLPAHPLRKRQFHASHHHHQHNCWDSEGRFKSDDPYCHTQAPTGIPDTTKSPGVATFPGYEFRPRPTPDSNWDSRPVTQTPQSTSSSTATSTTAETTAKPTTTTSAVPDTSTVTSTEGVKTTSVQTATPSTPATTTTTTSVPTTEAPTTTTTTAPAPITVTDITTSPSVPTTTTTVAPITSAYPPTTTTTGAAPTTAPQAPTTTTTVEITTAQPTPTTTATTQTTTTTAPTTVKVTTAPATSPVTTAPTTVKVTTAPVTTAPSTEQPTTTVHIPPENCHDTVDNCDQYGLKACRQAVYRPWAIQHCPVFCRFCTPVTATPVPCVDKVQNCREFDSGDLCTSETYYKWSHDNCFAYCGFGPCATTTDKSVTTPLTTTPVPVTTTTEAANATCHDTLDNCNNYADEKCLGTYAPWAKSHCAKRCGYCSEPYPCEDASDYCDVFPDEICTNPEYLAWSRTNCRKYCNLCATPVELARMTTGALTGSSSSSTLVAGSSSASPVTSSVGSTTSQP